MWVNRNDTLHDKGHIWQKNKRARWDSKIVAVFNENIQDNFLPEDLSFFQNGKKEFYNWTIIPNDSGLNRLKWTP